MALFNHRKATICAHTSPHVDYSVHHTEDAEMISSNPLTSKSGEFQGTEVKIGDHLLAVITSQTDPSATARFLSLCEANQTELDQIGREYDTKVQWNHSHPGQGRDWPIFRKREKLKDKLLHQAGIVDS